MAPLTIALMAVLTANLWGKAVPRCDKFDYAGWNGVSLAAVFKTGQIKGIPVSPADSPKLRTKGTYVMPVRFCGGIDVLLVKGNGGKVLAAVDVVPDSVINEQTVSYDCSLKGKKLPHVFGRVKVGDEEPIQSFEIKGTKIIVQDYELTAKVRCQVPAGVRPSYTFKESEFQREALEVDPHSLPSDCPIANTEAIVDKQAYGDKYSLKQIAPHPRTPQEKLTFPSGLELEVKSRGCSDMIHLLTFKFPAEAASAEKLKAVAKELLNLKVAESSFLKGALLHKIAKALEWKSAGNGQPLASGKGTAICLNDITHDDGRYECLEDVGILVEPKKVTLSHVNRP